MSDKTVQEMIDEINKVNEDIGDPPLQHVDLSDAPTMTEHPRDENGTPIISEAAPQEIKDKFKKLYENNEEFKTLWEEANTMEMRLMEIETKLSMLMYS